VSRNHIELEAIDDYVRIKMLGINGLSVCKGDTWFQMAKGDADTLGIGEKFALKLRPSVSRVYVVVPGISGDVPAPVTKPEAVPDIPVSKPSITPDVLVSSSRDLEIRPSASAEGSNYSKKTKTNRC